MRLRADGLSWQEIEGELVILDLQRSVYLTTNAAGALLTQQLTEERSLDELVTALMAGFAIDEGTARRDTEAFVAQLRDKKLLVAT